VKPSATRSACNCFTVRRCLRDFPDSVFSQPANFSEKGSSLLERSGVANFGSIVFAAKCLVTVLRDSPVRRAISRIDSFSRKCMRRMMFKSPMWITPLPPTLTAMGEGSHGSNLNGNYAPTRLSSGWKSTDKRKNAAVTRNVRLAAIKSFFRFLEYRQPAALDQVRRVLAIPFKKTDTRLVPYLLREELQALLDAPDPTTRDGIRDRAMLHVAVCAGLRVSELTGLKIDDIEMSSMSMRVIGKGRRERVLPLWKPAATALRAWLAIRGKIATPEVFVSGRGEALSRWGFAYLLKQHAAVAARQQQSLATKRVSPHVLRHTCAMIILQATQDIRKVSLWLGHATLTTTEVYTRGDPTEKLEAMEAIVPPHLRRGTFQPTDKLMALLKSTS